MTLTCKSDRSLLPVAGDSRHLLLSIEAPARSAASDKRAPVEIAFVIDRSGSMSGEKIRLAKQAVARAIDALGKEDKFSIVIFDSEVETIFPLEGGRDTSAVPATKDAKRIAHSALAEVEARNSTYLSGGWLTGAATLSGVAGNISRVLLLTDGLANVGEVNPVALEHHAAELRSRGVSLTTFGVGHDFDESLLQRLAAAGGGNFYFIENAAQIPDFIASELGEALEVVARRAILSVAASAGTIETLSVLAPDTAGSGQRFALGDLVADQVLSVVLRLTAPAGAKGDELTVTMTLSDEDGALGGASVVKTFAYAGKTAVAAETVDAEVMRAVAATDIARATQEAVALNRAGNFVGAMAAMSSTAMRYDEYRGADSVLDALLTSTAVETRTYGAAMSERARKVGYWSSSNLVRGRTAEGKAQKKGSTPVEPNR